MHGNAACGAEPRNSFIDAMRTACFGLLLPLLLSTPAMAQLPANAARSVYQQQLAACDPAQPRPAYNACVRAAGLTLDRSGATGAGSVVNESADGRATILESPGAVSPAYAPSVVVPQTTTSQDGRATLLVPSDSTIRSGVSVP